MSRKGFTLVELVVAIVVLGVILTVVYRFFFNQEKFLRRQRQWSELNIVSRKASTYISKEIRNIGYCDKTGGSGGAINAFGIINGTANSIEYSHDIWGPQLGVVDHPEDTHSIKVRGDTLYIDNDFALDNVISLEFTYVDTTGDTVPNISEVNADGDWELPVGSYPVEHIDYLLRLSSPRSQYTDTISYQGRATLRNKRP
jgi:prepilin-type N-terminal cleavage/methylation domain-containing protein